MIVVSIRNITEESRVSALIAIVCIVLVIIFWRILLPLALLGILVIGGIYLFDDYKDGIRKKEKAKEVAQLRLKIATAKKNASSHDKKWIVFGEADPASGIKIARTASITSNDGLCYLSVQKRINGARLTGLTCDDVTISEYDDIYVKFDTDDISRKMGLESYRDSDQVYIGTNQLTYSGALSYDEFITGLVTANSAAIKIPSIDSFWVRFRLDGSAAAINMLGKPM